MLHHFEVFREVRRVLKPDGTLWLNIGDSYNSHPGQRKSTDKAGWKQRTNTAAPACPSRSVPNLKSKDLVGIPWMTAFALRADGWYLRQDIIWHKPNPMPESVRDRCTKAHEYLFLLSKSANYYYGHEAIKEPFQTDPKERYGERSKATGRGTQGAASARGGDRDKSGGFPPNGDTRNKRSVWTVPLRPYAEAHFATFPKALIQPCILAGTKPGDTVLDPFAGSGTTGEVALDNGRKALLIELNPEYEPLIRNRTNVTMGLALG